MPNYHYEDIQLLLEKYNETHLVNPATIIDANHSNSGKKYEQQIRIVKDVLHTRRCNKDIESLVKGVMIEAIWSLAIRKSDAEIMSMVNPSLTRALAGIRPNA